MVVVVVSAGKIEQTGGDSKVQVEIIKPQQQQLILPSLTAFRIWVVWYGSSGRAAGWLAWRKTVAGSRGWRQQGWVRGMYSRQLQKETWLVYSDTCEAFSPFLPPFPIFFHLLAVSTFRLGKYAPSCL